MTLCHVEFGAPLQVMRWRADGTCQQEIRCGELYVWRAFPGQSMRRARDDTMKRAALALQAQPAAMGLEVETSVLAVSTSQCAASTAQQHGASVCTTAGSAAASRPALRLANSEGWVGVTSRAHCMAWSIWTALHAECTDDGLHDEKGHSSMRHLSTWQHARSTSDDSERRCLVSSPWGACEGGVVRCAQAGVARRFRV